MKKANKVQSLLCWLFFHDKIQKNGFITKIGGEKMFDLEEELKKLPAKPGVYIMHDKKDEIIYVGKAVSLKNRVRQYFQASRNVTPKIEKMISKIAYFEYIVTDSELEALVLECNLIKEHAPRYNTMLKDDKTYPYIKATIGEEYPRLLFVRNMTKAKKKDGSDKAKYYGPYTGGVAVKETLELVRKIFHIRTCNRNLPKDIGKGRVCLYYHIKQCSGPCQGYINKEAYRENFEKALRFLDGEYGNVVEMLEKKMQKAAEEMAYEAAAEYRDLLNSVKHISQKQKITDSQMEDRDVIAIAKAGEEAVVQVFFIRNGRLIGREHFHYTDVEKEEKHDLITAFLKQFYGGTPYIPKEIFLQMEIEERGMLEEWLGRLRGQKVSIIVPQKGKKERLVELAEKNASLVLQKDSERLKIEEKRTRGAVNELASWIGMGKIERIESYDISNISGFQSVGSMVVFENGKPKRNDYRKFKIKSVKGPDDYASMEEVLTRRFLHGLKELEEGSQMGKFTRFPDLILMDGGKGQVNIAKKVLEKLNLDIAVCGMVKDDNHRTRGIYFENKEILIDTHSEGFHLVTRIQDETHRFAIEYHRNLRGKTQVHSILDDIPGIGEVRRKALMKYFKSLENLKAAEQEEIANVPSMNSAAAKQVYEFFHKKER